MEATAFPSARLVHDRMPLVRAACQFVIGVCPQSCQSRAAAVRLPPNHEPANERTITNRRLCAPSSCARNRRAPVPAGAACAGARWPSLAMNSIRWHLFLAFGAIALGDVLAAESLIQREWTVDGGRRQALVHVPAQATTNPAPVVFVFHGHGGTRHHAARTFAIHTHWPEAIVVYPQGLNTPGQLTDPEGKRSGWQRRLGDQDNRDLKFFDAMGASLKQEYRVDARRLYATGHSNGGAFAYLLWVARGEQFAALAPSGAAALRVLPQLKPKPVLHIAGENDPLVKLAWQQPMINALRRLNHCGEGQPQPDGTTVYPSPLGAPVMTFIHPGGHEFPRAAPALIVKFFKAHALPSH